MKRSISSQIKGCLLSGALLLAVNATAQKDTSKMIIYLNADEIIHVTNDTGSINKFLGNAVFRQGTDTLYCDSLYQNTTSKVIEAFSNVRMAQAGGTQGTSDYLKYVSATRQAYMNGHVTLTDGNNRLDCNELSYNMGTKVGVFTEGGDLYAEKTHVRSNRGEYNVGTHEARFSGKVKISDPEYTTTSEDIGYNTEIKRTRFFAPSHVVADSGQTILDASAGYYDAKSGLADLTAHPKLWYGNQYLEGDTVFYDRGQGFGYAYGKVIAWDAQQLSALYCGSATYNRRKRTLLATRKPVLMQIKNLDTLYIRADTFYSAPDYGARRDTAVQNPKTADTLQLLPKQGKTSKKSKARSIAPTLTPAVDTGWADTTVPLYFSGYHHVLIFSDSLQGVCDSVVYTQCDSTIRMIYNPVAWSRNSQITGDTICMLLDSNRLKQIYVPNNAFINSLAGPENSGMFDQVQGKRLKAWFANNTITEMLVSPDAEAIYYPKDASGAYIGINQSKADRMRVFFRNEGIQKIKLEPEVHITLTPLEKADIPTTRLLRFKWLPERRPKDKYQLFR